MSLRAHATELLNVIVNDEECAFGWPITVTDPDGFTSVAPIVGRSQDIAQIVDPDTGVTVTGRLASAVVTINDLVAAGYTSLPRGIANSAQKPWVVSFDDPQGNTYTFKVSESNPDRTLGQIVLLLEAYVL